MLERIMQWIVSVALLLASTMTLAQAAPAQPSDCPTAKSPRGFVVERNESTKTDVFGAEDGTVHTILRSGGNTLLETTQFQGLFQLERIENGRRTIFRPKASLASLFPLKPGQKINVQFDVETGGQSSVRTVDLAVTQADTLLIGPCRYDVLKVERREAAGSAPLRFIDTDYYAPALRLVIAKEYREAGDRTNLVKFDRISPIK